MAAAEPAGAAAAGSGGHLEGSRAGADTLSVRRTAMKVTRLETVLTNAGLRNYLFVRLTTDTGLTGLGEASLEWQEKAVQTLLHEWVEERILGTDPFDGEAVIGGLIR